jgi:hypothetical protein
MPKKPPTPDSTGPMRMQPQAHGPTATQMLPTMPCAGEDNQGIKGEASRPARAPVVDNKKPRTRAEAVRAALARITRRKSLRKQRDAQKS